MDETLGGAHSCAASKLSMQRSGVMRKLTVVHVGRYDPEAIDGVIITVVGQCDSLLERGWRVEVWTFTHEVSEVEEREIEGGLIECRIPRFRNPLLGVFRFPKETWNWLRSRSREVDLLHIHSVFTPHNNLVARLGFPYAVTPNGGWSREVLQGRRRYLKAIWVRLMERHLWSNARFVQAVSPREADHLRSFPGIAPIAYIPNGVMSLPGGSRNAAVDGEGSRQSWLFLGRLAIEQKGLDTLIRAYAYAHRQEPALPDLVLVGPDFRGSQEQLEQLANEQGVADKVRFPGPLVGEEKAKAFRRASAFLHSSRWEGMPLAILEALGQGVPCLVSPETGIADWVVDKHCGWRAEANTVEYGEALLHLHRNPGEVRTFSGNAVAAVEADYSWSSIAGRLERAYLTYGIESR